MNDALLEVLTLLQNIRKKINNEHPIKEEDKSESKIEEQVIMSDCNAGEIC